MEFDFYFDVTMDMTHIEKHDVSVEEINEFFSEVEVHDRSRRDGSYVSIGKLANGRYLEVIFRKIRHDFFFIITAYDLEDMVKIDYIEAKIEGLL